MQDNTFTVYSNILSCEGIFYESIFAKAESFYLNFFQDVFKIFVQEKLARVIPIKIGDVLCYPKFKCIHLTNPGREQFKKDLHRYRFKEVLVQLFEHAQDYGASDEWLHFKLFAEQN